MSKIVFIDIEVNPESQKILDLGGAKEDGRFYHGKSLTDFVRFVQGADYVCGHNILKHDWNYIGQALEDVGIASENVIDTLPLSPLFFPTKPYHKLVKDDKLEADYPSNPYNDSLKARDLLYDEISAFHNLDDQLRTVFCELLAGTAEFGGFFRFLSGEVPEVESAKCISEYFKGEICENSDLGEMIEHYPVQLAYALSLIDSCMRNSMVHSITPRWVLASYPDVERLIFLLRNKPCLYGCDYCRKAFDPFRGLKSFFGYDSFRSYGGEPLQEKAVRAALTNKSLLAVFPTGGGKSLTFQIPALMAGEKTRALTVVISPLQSLMKDQVDNLEKAGITDAVTINGLLDPIERSKVIEQIEDGSATILYLSPESLRSRSIERMLLGRKIARFVIDEAHCFSSWGQDFRVDYLYIGDFIKSIGEKKSIPDGIPVSCFTATAKPKVIEDIRNYFRDKLSLDLELFTSSAARTNLRYQVFSENSDEDKYQKVRMLLTEKDCSAIVYVSRTRRAFNLARRLSEDGFSALAFHGRMEPKDKTATQNAFISGQVRVIVATSAFGMGVDKKDVGMVIHHDISDSLENYIQEAGRAGRDERLEADCYILFNDEDLNKHFVLLNQTRLTKEEIQQIWKAIKEITRFRTTVSQSALEIARKAGWDDSVSDMESRVKTALSVLEDAKYLQRGQNMPRVYADSILCQNAEEAVARINASLCFSEDQKVKAIRIIKKLIASRSRKVLGDESAEYRIDYISDHLGIARDEVIEIVNLLRQEKVLADAKDLTAYVKKGESLRRSLLFMDVFIKFERLLLSLCAEPVNHLNLKKLNELAEESGCTGINSDRIKVILNFWAVKKWIIRKYLDQARNHVHMVCLQPVEDLRLKLQKRQALSRFIVEYLFEKLSGDNASEADQTGHTLDFSVLELKTEYEKVSRLIKEPAVELTDVEDALFFLTRIGVLNIEGGFLVVYNRLTIERLEPDVRKRFSADDFKKMSLFYESKIQQIHIVGEYAKKMITDYKAALQFVDDYFHLNYSNFLRKYFNGAKLEEISRNITPEKFRQLFGELSPSQLCIINDKESRYIVVAAGPGSGKTRVLVHKLASLLLMEDIKHEQLLMVTFSRAAVTEFKRRLMDLIGNAAHYIEIKTFHSYCFDLLGKVGTLDRSRDVITETLARIKTGEVEKSRITKAVLVIDEAQDMDENEFNLICELMNQNEEMRVIAVGDDDQNIFGFRGSSSEYLLRFIKERDAVKYELVENHRSRNNLVQFSNQYVRTLSHRLKKTPVMAKQNENGSIRLVGHRNGNLVVPCVNDLERSDLSGTTCLLTFKNEDAQLATGLLRQKGIRAKLVQVNEGFNLFNLLEIRHFYCQIDSSGDVPVISEEEWDAAKRGLNNTFGNSACLESCNRLIKDFEETYPKTRYKSDLEIFIRESGFEDFLDQDSDTVIVSTIHKAKGKEFDNVYLVLGQFNLYTDEQKRFVYVGMTRAKSNLVIHTDTDYLDGLTADNMSRSEDAGVYESPGRILMQLTFRDVFLDYFIDKQEAVSNLTSGDTLCFDDSGCLNQEKQPVVRFSKQFLNVLIDLGSKGYAVSEARVNYIVYWKKEDSEQEIRVVLPELVFDYKSPG